MLRRAVARGELDAGRAAGEFLPHMIFGAVISRSLLEDREIATDYLMRYLDAVVLPALGIETG